MQPQEKRTIADRSQPCLRLIYDDICRRKPPQSIQRVWRRRSETLAILKIQFVISRAERAHSLAHVLQFAI